MLFTRPLQMLAVAAGAGSIMLAVMCSTAQAERPTYRNVSHGSAHGCPCPCPSGDAAAVDGDAVPVPADGEDLPEVADLSGDSGFASAPQSAVPNAIGDSMAGCFSAYGSGSGYHYPVCPSGRRFKISENNSALPQKRAYYNYHYFSNAQFVSDGTDDWRRDVRRHEIGFEYPFYCDMASIGVELPFENGVNPNYDGGDLGSTEFGNVSVYLKSVLYQDCCKTMTAGLGIDLPTGQDTDIDLGGDTFFLDNDVVILSPYVALLKADPCGCSFLHAFAQVDFLTDDYSVDANGLDGEIDGGTLLHLDVSYGYWLQQDCCGNGIAAIAELHYTTNIEGNDVVDNAGDELSNWDNELLNATLGANIARGCWDIRPAVVLPLFSRPDRAFDYELSMQVNRRF